MNKIESQNFNLLKFNLTKLITFFSNANFVINEVNLIFSPCKLLENFKHFHHKTYIKKSTKFFRKSSSSVKLRKNKSQKHVKQSTMTTELSRVKMYHFSST